MNELLYKEEAYSIIGAAMEVHNELGHGFLEAVYHEAMEKELKIRKIPFESGKEFSVYYKSELLKKKYFADMVCYNKIILEFKAADSLCDDYYAQVLNYLKCSKFKLGLLINFGAKSLEYKRVIWD